MIKKPSVVRQRGRCSPHSPCPPKIAKPEYPSPLEIVAKAAKAEEWVAIAPSDLCW
jgi:hypothetical protein